MWICWAVLRVGGHSSVWNVGLGTLARACTVGVCMGALPKMDWRTPAGLEVMRTLGMKYRTVSDYQYQHSGQSVCRLTCPVIMLLVCVSHMGI